MFTSCPQVGVKIKSFCFGNVCAALAFGMDMNCPDIRQVVHLGPPDDVESYVQETVSEGSSRYASENIKHSWIRNACAVIQ